MTAASDPCGMRLSFMSFLRSFDWAGLLWMDVGHPLMMAPIPAAADARGDREEGPVPGESTGSTIHKPTIYSITPLFAQMSSRHKSDDEADRLFLFRRPILLSSLDPLAACLTKVPGTRPTAQFTICCSGIFSRSSMINLRILLYPVLAYTDPLAPYRRSGVGSYLDKSSSVT
jgi:hypothetical protein